MIRSIHLIDFQAHHDLLVKFGSGVTSIVGPSDAGKSAIIRALRWVVFNRPLGSAFIREGARSAVVELEAEGAVVSREKSSSRNAYVLDGKELLAVSTDVPQEVTRVLRLEGINFQGQHDGPFWFSESAGEVSRQLNEIVNLGVMDATLASLAAALRKARGQVDVSTTRVADAENNRQQLRVVPRMVRSFEGVEQQRGKAQQVAEKRERAALLVSAAQTYGDRAQRVTAAAAAGQVALGRGGAWADLNRKAGRLRSLVRDGEEYDVVAHVRVPDVRRLTALDATYRLACARRAALAAVVVAGVNQTAEEARLRAQWSTLDQEWKSKMGKVCVLCGQNIQSQ